MKHFYGNDPNLMPPEIPPENFGTKPSRNPAAILIIAIAVAVIILAGVGLVMLMVV